jgi:hypothetical protein
MRLALIALASLLAGAGWAAAVVATLVAGRALPAHFPRGTEACFGRVYGAAFLDAHPNHKVSELYVYRAFKADLLGTPGGRTRAEKIADDRASPNDMWVKVMARFRDRPAAYVRSVQCTNDLEGAFCFADCDGAHFEMHPDGRGLVLDRTTRPAFVHLNGACGGDSSGLSAWLHFDKDGEDFHLDAMPIERCLAARGAATDSD